MHREFSGILWNSAEVKINPGNILTSAEFHLYTSMNSFLQTKNGNFHLFAQMENGNGKLPFVCCRLKWEAEVCFPWSANGKQSLTIAVSAIVPIYRYNVCKL
jgi:hypothetical protein